MLATLGWAALRTMGNKKPRWRASGVVKNLINLDFAAAEQEQRSPAQRSQRQRAGFRNRHKRQNHAVEVSNASGKASSSYG